MRLPLCVAVGVAPLVTSLVACGDVKPEDNVLDCGDVPGLLACNTFEADDPAWTTVVDRGVVVLDDADASGGAKALHATVAVGGGKAVRSRSVASADRYYARFYANVPAGADTTGMSLLHLGEPVAPFLGTNVEIGGGMLGAGVQSADVYDYPWAMPLGRWVCLELELVVSETGGRVIVRADGDLVVDRDGIDTRPAGGIGDVEIGLSYVAPAAANGTTVLIDDIVVARQPLASCPPAP